MQAHPLDIQGAWMRLLCQMWWEKTKEITMTSEEYGRLLGIPTDDAETTVATILRLEIASGRRENDGRMTIWCRRWKDELSQRVMARTRDQRYRSRRKADGTDDAKPTPPSSSSSSSSSSVPPPTPPGGTLQNGKFQEFKAAYPSRKPTHNWTVAAKAWSSRIRQGADPDVLIRGATNYGAYCQQKGSTNTEFVKMASTFLGPSKYWEQWQEPVSVKQSGASSDFSDIDYTVPEDLR